MRHSDHLAKLRAAELHKEEPLKPLVLLKLDSERLLQGGVCS
jgi:hypothetical protein